MGKQDDCNMDTKTKLALRVNYKCSICDCNTSGPKKDPQSNKYRRYSTYGLETGD